MALTEAEELELLELEEQEAMASQPPQPAAEPGVFGRVGQAIEDKAVDFASGLVGPKNLFRSIGDKLPIAGATAGGPVGAVAGEAARQMIGQALSPGDVPQTFAGRAGSMAAQAVAAKPALVGLDKAAQALGPIAKRAGNKAAQLAESVAGPKANVYKEAFHKGYKTYLAPSMDKAQAIFGDAMKKEGINPKIPVDARYDPQLGYARDKAREVVAKIEAGEAVTAEEALRGKQAIDRVIAATPKADKGTVAQMYQDREALDQALATQSGPLKDASTTYRSAIVKKALLNPTRINKGGEPSALMPMISGVSSAVTGNAKPLLYMFGSGPLATGAMATTAGEAYALGKTLGSNQTSRQALITAFVTKMGRQENR